MSRRTYKNPPIDEALCDFTFIPSVDWKSTFIGRFESQISERFGGDSREERTAGVKLNAKSGEVHALPDQFFRMIFPAKNGGTLATLRENRLSVNMLRPYAGWEAFRGLVDWTLQRYREVAAPIAVQRIGVRYINRVDLSQHGSSVSLDDYFNVTNAVTPFPEGRLSAYRTYSASTLEINSRPVTIATTFADAQTMGRPDSPLQFIIDIDVYQTWESDAGLPLNKVLKALDLLRDVERDAFERCITDSARRLFDQ